MIIIDRYVTLNVCLLINVIIRTIKIDYIREYPINPVKDKNNILYIFISDSNNFSVRNESTPNAECASIPNGIIDE